MRTITFYAFLLSCLCFTQFTWAQTYNDGPIQLQMRVREWDVTLTAPNDITLNTSFFNPGAVAEDEYSFKLWGRANAVNTTWFGGTCYEDEFDPSLINSQDFNDIFYNQTFATSVVPQTFDLRIDCHEDDVSTDFAAYFSQGLTQCANTTNFPRCDYNTSTCCLSLFGNCLFSESDDIRCDAQPFKLNMNYRLGPPCQWFNHGFVAGSGCVDNVYQPRVESFWRYTKGTGCNDAIDLGTLSGGNTLFHFNSNECYNNNFPASGGNDVFYSFTITQPMGVRASLCGTATFNTVVYILDPSCNTLAFNDDFCNLTSQVDRELCAPGTYYVVVDGQSITDAGTFTLSVSEVPNLLLQVNAGLDVNRCIGQTAVLGASPAAQFGAGGYIYNWSPATNLSATNVANPTFTPTTPGSFTYTLSVTDLNNCTITDNITINVGTPPTAGISAPGNLICNGTSMTLTGSGGTGSPAYQWLFNNGSIANANSSTYNANLQGNYNVVAYSPLGCADTSATVNIQSVSAALANVSVAGSTTVCQGTSAILNGYGIGLNYQWLNNNAPIAAATNNTYNATASGNYAVIMSFNGLCADTSAVVPITVNPLPIASISPNTAQTICQGQSISFTAGGGNTIQWYYNGLPIAGATNATYVATQAGNYYAAVTANNCTANTAVVNVNVKPVVNAIITASGNTSFCQGNSVTLVGSGNGGTNQTFTWIAQPNTIVGNANSLTVSNSGNYQFVLNNNGCADTSSIQNVTVFPSPVASLSPAGTLTTCSGNLVPLVAGGGNTYSWFQSGQYITNNASNTFTPNQTGGYYVIATSANGCSDTSAITNVTVNTTIAATVFANGPLSFCQGESVILTGSGTGGIGQTYSWRDANTGAIVGNNNTFTATATGTYQFILTNGSCADTSQNISVNVFPLPSPMLTPAGPQTICSNQSLTLTASGGSSYTWYQNGLPASNNTPNLTINTAGNYYATVTDVNNCSASTPTFLLNVTPLLPANTQPTGNQAICAEESLVVVGSSTGSLGQSYTWLQTSTGNVVGNANAVSLTEPGSYVFILNNNGCADTSQTINLTVNPLPAPYLSPNGAVAICGGGAVTILGFFGATFHWYENGQLMPGNTSNQYVAMQEGNYFAIAEDINGCSDTTEILQLSYTPNPEGSIASSGSTVICEGESVTLSAMGGQSYQWLVEGNLIPNATSPQLTVNTTGSYTVIASNNCGQDTSSITSVQVNPIPTAGYITEVPYFYQNVPIQFVDQSLNAANWQWAFGDNGSSTLQNPVYAYTETGVFPLVMIVSDDIGCADTLTANVEVREAMPFVPNIFTPNGDNVHDVLETQLSAWASFTFTVFDRWGKAVFTTTNPTEYWDGNLNGKPAQAGVYYYSLIGKDYAGKGVDAKGWVMLAR